MPGSMNDVLIRINLKTKSSSLWSVPEDLKELIGGIGYGTKILIDEVNPDIDPLSSANKVIFSVGPLTGTAAPMHPQCCLVTKSPLSGTILNSYAGGFLGPEIKFCGIDGVILEAAGDEWTILLIDDKKVRFESAAPVLGETTEATETYIKEKFGGDYRTLSIGPAGEKLVAMAAVFSETRTFGRGGGGGVLGAKKVKAIGFRGSFGVSVADGKEFHRLVSKNMETLMAARANEYSLIGMFSRFGTGAGMSLVQNRGGLATGNSRFGSFEKADCIDGQYYEKNFFTRKVACFSCPIHCGRVRKFDTKAGIKRWGRGPEYETMYSLGTQLENGDPSVLAEANRLTEDYGIDSITTGVTIAWAFELAEKGLIDEKELKFGDADSILTLIHKIGKREGIGDLLAKGPKTAAEELGIGSASFAMQVKNSGFAAWMPRRMKGTGLSFATSNRGACHKRAPIGAEITGQIDMGSTEGKAILVRKIQDTVNAIFTLISCRFHEFETEHVMYPRFIRAATGRDMDLNQFYLLGERIWNLEKLFNVGAGFTRTDDGLPERCYEPVKGKMSESAVLTREEFASMLDEYYKVRGWDRDGIPMKDTIDRLGLEEYGKRLT